MRIGVIGASGFVGARLCAMAGEAGHGVVRFSRVARPGFRLLDGVPDLGGLDAVVNLGGESILGLWTRAKRERIVGSRVEGTARVVEAMGRSGVGVLINASAVGYYGNTGEGVCDEGGALGNGFLAQTCAAWEAAAVEAEGVGARVVRLRIGFVTGAGGAMGLVMPVFRWGLGGRLGSGRQWMSCIHVDDVAGMILWALENEGVGGAVNAVNPEPVRNSEFTRVVARVAGRPALVPAPGFALKLALGELSRLMLDSCRVVPRVAREWGYRYRYPRLEEGLRASWRF
jgi:uncharacterized protein